MRLVLASESPRRAEILKTIGLDFEVLPPAIEELRLPEENPDTYVERLARTKAMAVAGSDAVTLAADTVVVHEGRVLGKPAHPDEARAMLQRLQGSSHQVLTGIAVVAPDGRMESLVDSATVTLMPMTAEEIDDYIDTGEPMDKAGGYALQGLAARFVSAVEGSPYTVIGLPAHLLARLIGQSGYDLGDFAAKG
jgi:septum formation protein